MRIKDTIHFDWYKKFFIFTIIGIFVYSSAVITGSNFTEVITNLDQMLDFLGKIANPDFSYIPSIIPSLIKTLKISVLGTFLGVSFALPVAFLATTYVTKNIFVTTVFRLILNIVRTIPTLLLAAILVAILGIGEFTGVLTISIFTFGVISQLVYESIETIDLSPIEAMESVGANKIQVAFYAILPQIVNSIYSYIFYALEINVRASTVLGYVGAGGIGIILNTSLALFRYDRVSIVIIVIFFVVLVVDFLGEYIRRRLAWIIEINHY